MIRILIVNDDAAGVEALHTALSIRYPRAILRTASSARDAVMKLLQAPYTALVVDSRVAAFDVVLKVSRLLNAKSEMVVISDDRNVDPRVLAVRLGTDVILHKPLDRDMLMAWLDSVIERGREWSGAAVAEDLLHIKAVVQAVDGLLFMADPDWSILFFNRAAEILTGYGVHEVYGKNLLQLLVPPDWRSSLAQPFPSLLGKAKHNPWVTKAGQVEMLQWRYSIVEVEDYSNPCLVGLGIPVSEHTQARAVE